MCRKHEQVSGRGGCRVQLRRSWSLQALMCGKSVAKGWRDYPTSGFRNVLTLHGKTLQAEEQGVESAGGPEAADGTEWV